MQENRNFFGLLWTGYSYILQCRLRFVLQVIAFLLLIGPTDQKMSNFPFLIFLAIIILQHVLSNNLETEFRKFNRTCAIAPLPPIGPIRIPFTITVSALPSKLLGNSKVSHLDRVFSRLLLSNETIT